ncbi:MAG: hypothetical protein U1F31_12100 [Steroidobacteraceae bacterium]|jgi:hypothetical protein
MDLETLRPIITGTIGGLLSLWLMKRWARYVPDAYKGKGAEQLLSQYRASIVVANVLFIGTILIGVYLFKAGHFPSTSWRHLFLVVGVAILAPLAALLLPAIGKGRSQAVEAVTAFAIAERTPLPVLAIVVLAGVVCLASALGGLAW